MMSKDIELFELCKEVSRRTTWEGTGYWWHETEYERGDVEIEQSTHKSDLRYTKSYPLYTSDYVLEKLGNYLELKHFGNSYDVTQYVDASMFSGSSDTPIKALLKLTIALCDAGELTNTDKENV